MAKKSKETWNNFKKFVKNRILFNVPKEEKERIRTQTMIKDHRMFCILLIVIFVLQLAMVLYTLIGNGFTVSGKKLWYLICYIVLGMVMIISLPLINYFFDKKKSLPYFIVTTFDVNVFFIWALAITCIDCLNGTELTTFAYVSLALAAFITLEPWIFIVDTITYVTALNLIIYFVPDMKYYNSVLISSISIALLTMIAAVVNFNRRVKSMNLEKEVTDLNALLTEQIHIDALTKINNRLFLTEHIDDTLNIGKAPSGVLMFDIDDFKAINDTYGHQNGDIALKTIGDILIEFMKHHKDGYCARYGGEEFLVYFTHTTKEEIIKWAEELKNKVATKDIVLIDEEIIHINISIGAAMATSGMNYSALINKADSNLYYSKKHGKNMVHFE